MQSSNEISRRDAVRTIAGMTAAGLVTGATEVNAEVPLEDRWIDAHSHIWPPTVDKYPLEAGKTVADLAPPSFTDDELLALAAKSGVGRVVLIQHNGYHGFDNRYLIDAAAKRPERFRVVGMVDSRKPGAGDAIRKLLPMHVTGFRITPARLGKDWLETPGMADMWRTAAETRQAMCCLINPSDLPDVDTMCEKFPDTPVVIDHFARVGIDGTIHKNELKNLLRLARHKHTAVKVSAYYALGKKQQPYLDLLPMIKAVVEEFGPQRCMWASDCPYQVQGDHTYPASIGLIQDHADFLSARDRQWLLRDTAQRVYFL